MLSLALAFWLKDERGHAADPQPYEVTIAPTGDAALDAAAQASSTLLSLHDTAPVGPFALIGRARNDVGRMQTALNSFGYYDGRVAITIADHPLDDPALVDLLDRIPPETSVPVKVTLTTGPEFHLRSITLPPGTPAAAREALQLQPGDPARAADVLAAGERMQTALLNAGHALARVGEPQAYLIPDARALDVSFPVEAGPRVDLGRIAITGERRLNESYIRRRLLLQPGQVFDPAAIAKARQDLAAVPALGAVRITPGTALDADGRLPMTVDVSERPLHAVNLSAAFSTDEGGSVGASWTHRNLWGNAEMLTLGAAASQLGGTAARQPGYNAYTTLVLPDWLQRGQSLTFNLLAVREYLDAYDRTAAIIGATLARRLTEELTVSGGLQFEKAYIEQEGIGRNYTLLQAPLGVTWDSTHDPFNPVSGVRANVLVTPTYSMATGAGRDASFVIVQASASTYLDVGNWLLGTEGRSILALRGFVGAINGAAVFDVPPDQRFYAGGGGSIRGFRYQSVGPKFPSGNPTGGNSVDFGSIEFRQRFGTSWGAAVFVDAGQVGTNGVPFSGNLAVGAGVGVRYYTAIGPIRADVAVPLTRERGGDDFGLYIGIGQAF